MADKRPKDIINFQHGYWKATKKQRFSQRLQCAYSFSNSTKKRSSTYRERTWHSSNTLHTMVQRLEHDRHHQEVTSFLPHENRQLYPANTVPRVLFGKCSFTLAIFRRRTTLFLSLNIVFCQDNIYVVFLLMRYLNIFITLFQILMFF